MSAQPSARVRKPVLMICARIYSCWRRGRGYHQLALAAKCWFWLMLAGKTILVIRVFRISLRYLLTSCVILFIFLKFKNICFLKRTKRETRKKKNATTFHRTVVTFSIELVTDECQGEVNNFRSRESYNLNKTRRIFKKRRKQETFHSISLPGHKHAQQ